MISKLLKAILGGARHAWRVGPEEIHRVQGSGGNVYAVNMTRIECSCPDFYKRRRLFPSADPRRLCKHLIRTYLREGAPDHDFDLYLIFFQLFCESSGFPLGYRRVLTDSDGYRFEIVAWEDAHWFNVITTHPGFHEVGDVFGYSPYEFRWASGEEAPDARDVEATINAMVGQKLPEPLEAEVEVYRRVAPENAHRGKEHLLYGRIGDHKLKLRVPSRNGDYHYLEIDRDVHLPVEFRGDEPVFRGEAQGAFPRKYAHIKSPVLRWIRRERKQIADSRSLALSSAEERLFHGLLDLLPDERRRRVTSCEKLKSYTVVCIGRDTNYWVARVSAKRDHIQIKMRDGQQFWASEKEACPVTQESVVASFDAAILDDIHRGPNSVYSKDFPEMASLH